MKRATRNVIVNLFTFFFVLLGVVLACRSIWLVIRPVDEMPAVAILGALFLSVVGWVKAMRLIKAIV